MNSWFTTQEPRVYNGEKTVSPINGVRKTGQPQAKEWNCTANLHHIQKSTENGLKLQHKT